MEFGIEKLDMLIMISGKQQMTERIDLPNQEKIPTFGENVTYKNFGILEPYIIKQAETKENIIKEYFWRTRKLQEIKLYCRNLIKMSNIWAVPLVRYLELFLKSIIDVLQQIDQRTRNLMGMHEALHIRYYAVSR